MPSKRPKLPVTRKGLTAQEEVLCRSFVSSRCSRTAYVTAFGSVGDAKRDRINGSRILAKPQVQLRIRELQDELVSEMGFAPEKALQYFLQIAYADPNELVSLRVGACRYCHGDGHGYQWREGEYMEALAAVEKFNEANAGKAPEKALPDIAGGFGFDHTAEPHIECPMCGGEGERRVILSDTTKLSPGAKLLYGGVKETAHGTQVIVADRMKAMELAARLIGAFEDKVSIRAELKAMSTVVLSDDPAEAAKAYLDMVRSSL